MPRRSPRRSLSNTAAISQHHQHDDVPENIEASFRTPKKRRRKVVANNDGEKEYAGPSTPSTPDLTIDASPVSSSAAAASKFTSTTLQSGDNGFIDLNVPPAEFRPSASLTTGQSFHWTALAHHPGGGDFDDSRKMAAPSSAWGAHDATDWIGTLRMAESRNDSLVVVHVRETPTTTLYKVLYAPPDRLHGDRVDAFLRDYFQLHVSLADLYDSWSRACPRLRTIAQCIPGVRMLQQDPWETLLSFICSSNNNIPRITSILATLRREYGQRIPLPPQCGVEGDVVYSFPSLEELRAKATEADLRRLGWGYRAKYVMQTMETLHDLGGEAYLSALRNEKDPVAVQEALLQFAGVGRKVADCVALFSLQQTRAIPVDVHVWNIARRDYDPDRGLATIKSLTPTVYKQVGDIFRDRFGDYAGWAHSLLFVAELPSFRPVLPESLLEEMEEFKQVEQARKRQLKQAKAEK